MASKIVAQRRHGLEIPGVTGMVQVHLHSGRLLLYDAHEQQHYEQGLFDEIREHSQRVV